MKFKTEVALTLATGANFLGEVSIGELFEEIAPLAKYMIQDKDVWLHDIGRIAKSCKPYIYSQHDWMEPAYDTFVEDGDSDWEEFLEQCKQKYGEELEIIPMHLEDYEDLDPEESLRRMGVDEGKIIKVDLTQDEEPPSLHGDINW